MNAVDLTRDEWRILRDAVVSYSARNATDDRIATELHKKLAQAAESSQVCLLINTDRR